MAWFVHYWNEIDNRNVCSSEISAREDGRSHSADRMPSRFAPPWTIDDHNDACFIVKDRNGYALA